MSVQEDTPLRDRRGAIRSPATLPGAHAGRRPASKGRVYPPHPWDIDEIVRFLDAASKPARRGRAAELSAMRLRALFIILWRTGLRVSESLALEPRDLDPVNQTVTVRRGKGGQRRVVRMDRWGWDQLRPWLEVREHLPFGPVFCVLTGSTTGFPMLANEVRRQFRATGKRAGLRRRCNPHSLRHTMAIEMSREKFSLRTVQRQLGHKRLDVTEAYLVGMGDDEVLQPVADRPRPMMPVG